MASHQIQRIIDGEVKDVLVEMLQTTFLLIITNTLKKVKKNIQNIFLLENYLYFCVPNNTKAR